MTDIPLPPLMVGGQPVLGASANNQIINGIKRNDDGVKNRPSIPPRISGAYGQPGLSIEVRNDTGADLNMFDTVGLKSQINVSNENEMFQTAFEIVDADEPANHGGLVAILTDELPDGTSGNAWITGCFMGRYARDTDFLWMRGGLYSGQVYVLSSVGPIEIIWEEDVEDPTVEHWALFRVGPLPEGVFVYKNVGAGAIGAFGPCVPDRDANPAGMISATYKGRTENVLALQAPHRDGEGIVFLNLGGDLVADGVGLCWWPNAPFSGRVDAAIEIGDSLGIIDATNTWVKGGSGFVALANIGVGKEGQMALMAREPVQRMGEVTEYEGEVEPDEIAVQIVDEDGTLETQKIHVAAHDQD